jgi:prepilin-type N-terminal cleavage/methylation domain-containing protein/prepilin-type processing-associated H-X9-DG protein
MTVESTGSQEARIARGSEEGATGRGRNLGFGRDRRAFTIIELLIVIAVMAVLIALIAGVVKHVREQGRQLQCENNLKQVGTAMLKFASMPQNQMRMPQMAWVVWDGYWVEQAWPYYQTEEILACPSDAKPYNMTEALNQGMRISTNDYWWQYAEGTNSWVAKKAPWWDPEGNYRSRNEWNDVLVSYRGSCDGYRSGGYGPKVFEYKAPSKALLLDEAWDNTRWGARQCSRGPDIWPGWDPNNVDNSRIDWDRNWLGLTRHSGGANFLMMDGGVRWIDAYSGPMRLSFFPEQE